MMTYERSSEGMNEIASIILQFGGQLTIQCVNSISHKSTYNNFLGKKLKDKITVLHQQFAFAFGITYFYCGFIKQKITMDL